MNENNLEIINDSKNTIINQYFEEKEVNQSKDYKVQYVKISKKKNLSAYLIVKQNHRSLTFAKKSKKAKTSKYEVVFAGLRQPTKNISITTYNILSLFIKRFKILDIDICFDGTHELEIIQKNISKYQWNFKEYISANRDTKVYYTSFYINKPKGVEHDADRYKKIILYDKYKKESKRKTLDSDYRHWKRLEATIKVDAKLKNFMIEDYFLDIFSLVRKHFNVQDLDLDYIQLQLLLLKDRRTHSKTNEDNLNKSFIDIEAHKEKTKRIDAMNNLVTDALIVNIQDRSKKINATKLSLIRLWFEQGSDLIQLQTKLQCTQIKLTTIVNISKGGVYNYMKLANDSRIKKLLDNSHSMGVDASLKSLDKLTQKDLVKLTSLNDMAFTQAVSDGRLPIPKNNQVQSRKTKDATVTLKEHCEYESKIQKLQAEIKALKKTDANNSAEVSLEAEIIKPSPKKSNSKKSVLQINKTTGKTINTFKSIAMATIATKVGGSSISKCANDKYNQAGGYIWKFIDIACKGTVHLFSNY